MFVSLRGVVGISLLLVSLSSQSVLEDVLGLTNFRSVRNFLTDRVGRTSKDPAILEKAQKMNKLQARIPEEMPFPCQTEGFRSSSPPSTVHMLKPGDIDVIGAMGDSLTVGTGLVATSVVHLAAENRGLSWSIGGQGTWREYVTLPNILKEFNPNLFGYALGDALTTSRDSQFNVAEAGAISGDMPYMAQLLVKRMQQDPRVKLNDHWKLITYMIGPNDFCTEICYSNNMTQFLENFRQVQITVLRTIRDGLPRTLVNLVPTPHLRELRILSEENKPNRCRALNHFECPCLFSFKFQKNLPMYYEIMERWQQVNKEVAEMEEFNNREDFTIVYQPFTVHASVPKLANNLTDYTYMSQDCFHFSQKFNAEVGNALWNNMMEPEGEKSSNVERLFHKFLCPSSSHPYIFTRYNSNYF